VVPDAEAALASVQAAFTAGDVGLTEVLQVTREWIDARQGGLDWQRALAEAEAMLVRWR
jgi:outer membrane protein TolC